MLQEPSLLRSILIVVVGSEYFVASGGEVEFHLKESRGGRRVGCCWTSRLLSREVRSFWRSSRTLHRRAPIGGSASLLLAAPSVPSATLTPAASKLVTGQVPLASFIFDSGQWMTLTPCAATSSISSGSSWVMWTASKRGERSSSSFSRVNGR